MKEDFGITPEQFCDYKTLRGDTSDNIPGVRGIGEVTARDLLQQYGTVENIYENLEKLTPAVRKKMEEGRESAKMSKALVTLNADVEIDFDLEACRTHNFNLHDVMKIFECFEFRSLMKKLSELDGKYIEARQAEQNGVLPLVF